MENNLQKKHTHVNLIFKCIAGANDDVLNNTNLITTAEGTLDEVMEAVKELK